MSKEFTEKYFIPAVKDFVSTVLLIDDQLVYENHPQAVEIQNDALIIPTQGTVQPYVEGNTLVFPNSSSSLNDTNRKVYVDDLIKDFSTEGLLVTPINPSALGATDRASCLEILLNLAKKSDVIILDWDMRLKFGSDDLSANELSLSILNKLDEDNRYRLVIIYTADGESEVIGKMPKVSNIDVKIYGKSRITGTNVKTYKELACQISLDYLAAKTGLLSSLMLQSLTQLRYSSYAILDNLKSEFDKSVICHHLLLGDYPAFQEFCEGIVQDEIFAYLKNTSEDDFFTNHALKFLVEEKDFDFKGKSDTEAKTASKITEYINSLEHEDFESTKKEMNKFLKTKLSANEIKKLQNFSFYSSILNTSLFPALRLGCIVKNSDSYYLCIQPACDSVRIPTKNQVADEPNKYSPRTFVFIELKRSDDMTDLFIKENDEFISLKICYNQIKTFSFVGNNDGKVMISDGCYEAYKENFIEEKLHYVCCLKPMFAQKIANNFAANISRVGIDQFEWLRLKGRI